MLVSHSSSPERQRLPCILTLPPLPFCASGLGLFEFKKHFKISCTYALGICLSNGQCVHLTVFWKPYGYMSINTQCFQGLWMREIFSFAGCSSVCWNIASHHIIIKCSILQWQMCTKFVHGFKLCQCWLSTHGYNHSLACVYIRTLCTLHSLKTWRARDRKMPLM